MRETEERQIVRHRRYVYVRLTKHSSYEKGTISLCVLEWAKWQRKKDSRAEKQEEEEGSFAPDDEEDDNIPGSIIPHTRHWNVLRTHTDEHAHTSDTVSNIK